MKRPSNLGLAAREAAKAIRRAGDLLSTPVTCDTVTTVQAIQDVQQAVDTPAQHTNSKRKYKATRFRLSSRIFK